MYKPTDKMSDLIASHYKILFVMSRFGIPLGVGDKTIDEVCSENDVDVDTFLVIVEILLENTKCRDLDNLNISLPDIMKYLTNSHDYFLNFRLPNIRENLSRIVNTHKSEVSNELSKAIIYYFDEYVAEVKKHMEYENRLVFPYINTLIDKMKSDRYNIGVFVRQHNHVEERMTEFKNIIIKYYPAKSTNDINSIMVDIFVCEEDLATHIYIEDNLLVPMVKHIEKQLS